MELGLAGKRCLVSGASRGIGRAIALALAGEGARVAAIARGAPDLARLEVELNAASPITHEPGPFDSLDDTVRSHGVDAAAHATIIADVSTAAGATSAVDGAAAALGGLDVVIANVGKSFARDAAAMDDADFAKSLDTNLWSTMRVVQRSVPHLRPGSSIVMIASIWGRESGGAPGYNVGKAGVIALAKALARDYAPRGIRVNSVAPGSILFPGGSWARRRDAEPEAMAAFVARELPLGRFGTPEEVANVVVFLASPRASLVTGACIPVDGGQSHAL
ncbi:MAG: SDR family NAD(P)-dependent oxidoreductase [Kofleriaceae bacterium]